MRLIRRHGFDRRDLLAMTPREIAGALWFAEKDAQHEAGEQLALATSAARGEARAVKKQIKELTKD